MNILIIGLGRPGNNTVDSMFSNDRGEYNFLNVDGDKCYVQTSISPSLLLDEDISDSGEYSPLAISKDKIEEVLRGNDMIFLVIWPHDLIGFGTIAFPVFTEIAQQLEIPIIGFFISSSFQYHKLEKIKAVVGSLEKGLFASMRIMLDSFGNDLPQGLSTGGFMYNNVGPGLLQIVKTITTITDSHNLVGHQKSIGLIKTGFGIASGINSAVIAMTDALTDKTIDIERLKNASKIWVTSSSSQSLSYAEIEDMKLILDSTIGKKDGVFWEHTVYIDLYDNFQVSIAGGKNN